MIGGVKLQTERVEGELSMTTAILMGPKPSIFTYQLSLSYSPYVLPSFPCLDPSLLLQPPHLLSHSCHCFSQTCAPVFALISLLLAPFPSFPYLLHALPRSGSFTFPSVRVYGVVGVQVKTGRIPQSLCGCCLVRGNTLCDNLCALPWLSPIWSPGNSQCQ